MAKKEKVQKPLYKKWWFWVVAVSIVGAVGTGLFGGAMKKFRIRLAR